MVVAIASEKGCEYPGSEDYFSPAIRYPEYPFDHLASRPNQIYELVRSTLRDAGLDAANFGRPQWNPLGDYVRSGARVFVLCNFVHHRRFNEDLENFESKCTHASVLRAVIDYLAIASGVNGKIFFGNAPLQSCSWDLVLEETGAARLPEFYAARGFRIEARDLRLLTVERSFSGRDVVVGDKDPARHTVTVKLREASELSPLSRCTNGAATPFRVADYDARVTESSHRDGEHQYVIARDILDADVIVSVPKLKTHEKVGITCGLKGFVGIVGSKDCLAHHRFGGSDNGGDEYPGSSRARRALSGYHDWVQQLPRESVGRSLHMIIDRNLRRTIRRFGAIQAGAWYGNDTCWRMALDLTRIAHFADRCGIMRDKPARRHLTFIDGVIAGEGNGPRPPARCAPERSSLPTTWHSRTVSRRV